MQKNIHSSFLLINKLLELILFYILPTSLHYYLYSIMGYILLIIILKIILHNMPYLLDKILI